jgi:hypothetical protein
VHILAEMLHRYGPIICIIITMYYWKLYRPRWSWGCVHATGAQVAGSNLAEGNGFLWTIKIQSATSFGDELKQLVICRRFMACKRIVRVWKRCSVGKTQRPHFSPNIAPLLDVSTGKEPERALADESGLIRNCERKQWANAFRRAGHVYKEPCRTI